MWKFIFAFCSEVVLMILPQKIDIPSPLSDIMFYVGLVGLFFTLLYWIWQFLKTFKRRQAIFDFGKSIFLSQQNEITLATRNVSWRKIHNISIEIYFCSEKEDEIKKVIIKREKFSINQSDYSLTKVVELTNNSIMIVSDEYFLRYDHLLSSDKAHFVEFILRKNNDILDNLIISLRVENNKLSFSKI